MTEGVCPAAERAANFDSAIRPTVREGLVIVTAGEEF